MDLKKAVSEKTAEKKPEKVAEPIKKRPIAAHTRSDESIEKYTGLFDLSAPGVYIIGTGKRNGRNTGGTYCMQSVYFSQDERDHLRELEEKYGSSASAIIRSLIANAI